MRHLAPVPVLPSPKDHAYDATDPSLSVEPDPSKLHDNAAQLAVNVATGATSPGATVTDLVPVAPRSSVTVSVIV